MSDPSFFCLCLLTLSPFCLIEPCQSKWHLSLLGSYLGINLPLLHRAHLYMPGAVHAPLPALSNLPKSLFYISQNIIEILFWPKGNPYWYITSLSEQQKAQAHCNPSRSHFCFISFRSHHIWQIYISSILAPTILITLDVFDEVGGE